MTILQTVELMRLHPASLSFLFVLLPLALFVFYLAPGRLRPAVLLLESLGFYLLVETNHFALLLLSIALDYLALRLMERYDKFPRYRKWCFAAGLSVNLALMLSCAAAAQLTATPYVLGVQLYGLSAISALWDAYRREIPYEQNPIYFALYIAFFPRLYTGPIQPYRDFAGQLGGLVMKPGTILVGWGQYLQGAFKAALLGGQLHALSRAAGDMDSVTMLSSWMQVFALAFALYFTLSGFSDIARGIGAMFGLSLPKNYYYPFQSRDVEDFFNRFNITINKFMRDTVYPALRGSSPSKWIDAMSILVTGMLLGLWFGLRVNYLLWGAFLALFVVLERYAYPALLESVPLLFRRLGTLCVVLASFTIYSADSPLQSAALIGSMFNFRHVFDEPALYLLSSNWLLLVCSCFFATNIIDLGVTKLRRAAPAFAAVLFGACDIAILVLYTALSL